MQYMYRAFDDRRAA